MSEPRKRFVGRALAHELAHTWPLEGIVNEQGTISPIRLVKRLDCEYCTAKPEENVSKPGPQ